MIAFTVTAAVLILAPAKGLVALPVNGKKEEPGWCHGRRQEVELVLWKKTAKIAGVKPGLETFTENCIGLSSS